MKQLIGFIIFWIGVGMTIMLFLDDGIPALLICAGCLALGYYLFKQCK